MKFKESAPTFIFILFLLGCLIASYVMPLPKYENETKVLDSNIVVPTLITKLDKNAIWTGTLNLLWNDLKEINQGNIESQDKNNLVYELNQAVFSKDNLSSNTYYTKYGYMTPSLKEEIYKSVKEKFNEESSILNNYDFKENSKDYFFYSTIVKNFKFKNPFDVLSSRTFGIDSESNKELKDNLKVLYYNNDKDYAVILYTTTPDEIILAKGLDGNNFKEIYDKIDFLNPKDLEVDDTITISNFDFEVNKEYKELENIKINLNNEESSINKVIESIKFKLNNEGGKLKSESGVNANTSSSKGRHFDFSNNFVMFIREKEKNLPYFAIKVDDIENFR